MRVHLNISVLAVLVAAGIGAQSFAYAKNLGEDVVNEERGDVRAYINTQQRSLYQIALLSGISISELRQINKGLLNETDIVRPGERILLPVSSPLLSAGDVADAASSSLPVLANTNNDGKKTDVDYQVASALQLLGQQDWENMTSDKIKDQAKDRVRSQAEGYIRSQVNATVIDPIETAARNLLGKFGTVQLDLNVSDEFSLRGSSLKLFSPWYDSDNTVIFTQMSVAEHDKRTIGNFGIGQRWDVNNKKWLLGYNVFLDHDFTRGHNRLGVGLEAWADYFKMSANYYHPLSDWKESRDFVDYLERAARGFDVTLQGYLPSYPHLGASLKYEQYFGDEVALFGKNKQLEKDPKAVTVGVDYTPVPMFTIKGQHKQGAKHSKSAQVDFTMNYRIGVPLKDQLDPDKVALARTIKGSRYDFVDRNNNIVLEYKEQTLTVELAAVGVQPEGTVVKLTPAVKSRVPIKAVTWSGDVVPLQIANAGKKWSARSATPVTAVKDWTIVMPAYSTTQQKHPLVMHVEDINGRKGQSNTVYIQSSPSAARKPYLTVSAAADGVRIDGVLQFADQVFTDEAFYSKYPNSTKAPTQKDLESILEYYNVYDSAGNKVNIILGSNASKEPDGTYVILKEIIKETVDGADRFSIVVSNGSDNNLGGLTLNVHVEPYGESNISLLDLSGNFNHNFGYLVVIAGNGDETSKYAAVENTGGKWNIAEQWMKVGETFKVYAYNKKSDFDVTNPEQNQIAPNTLSYIWALTGKNDSACSTTAIDLTVPLEVSKAQFYVAQGKETSKATDACAGDQGFNLGLSVVKK